jgi:hypothetical protein
VIHTKHDLQFSVKIREYEFDCEKRIIPKSLVFSVFLGDAEINDVHIRDEFVRMIEESPEEFALYFDPEFIPSGKVGYKGCDYDISYTLRDGKISVFIVNEIDGVI